MGLATGTPVSIGYEYFFPGNNFLIIDESFDSHPVGPLPDPLSSRLGSWSAYNRDSTQDSQGIVADCAASVPHSYRFWKKSSGNDLSNAMGIIAYTAMRSTIGYQEARIRLMQPSAQFHLTFSGPCTTRQDGSGSQRVAIFMRGMERRATQAHNFLTFNVTLWALGIMSSWRGIWIHIPSPFRLMVIAMVHSCCSTAQDPRWTTSATSAGLRCHSCPELSTSMM